jgi:hypothetical protein
MNSWNVPRDGRASWRIDADREVEAAVGAFLVVALPAFGDDEVDDLMAETRVDLNLPDRGAQLGGGRLREDRPSALAGQAQGVAGADRRRRHRDRRTRRRDQRCRVGFEDGEER